MGTNYYFSHRPPCPHCERAYPALHIGKSSVGWCFALRVHPEEGIVSLADWRARFAIPGVVIRDEYGERVPTEKMLEAITRRTWNGVHKPAREWYDQNHAEPGPNGLARHRVDGDRVLAHGEGTYDLMAHGFS